MKRLVPVLLAALGCATTQVSSTSLTTARLARPERILVHRFAASAEDVRLDHSLTAEAAWKLQNIPESTERQDVARKLSDILADQLVEKLQKKGFPAQRADGPPPGDGVPTLVVGGQFLAMQEGSRTARVVIGLGAGKSKVRTAVHVTEVQPWGSRLVDAFEIDAESGATPGMLETMGAGAAAGHLATSAAVSVGKSVASEKFGDDVDADARRTAEKIVTVLESVYTAEGWSLPPQAQPHQE